MTEAAAPYDPALAFSIHSALVGVHGAALSYAPFVPNSLCVVEIGTYLNWYGWPQLCSSILDQCALMPHPDVLRKNGRGDHEWRSSGFIAPLARPLSQLMSLMLSADTSRRMVRKPLPQAT